MIPPHSLSASDPYAGVRRSVLINMILVPFIPFLLALIIGNHFFSGSIEQGTIASMKRIAGDHRQMIESFLSDVFMGYRNIPHFIIAVARKENNRLWVIRARWTPSVSTTGSNRSASARPERPICSTGPGYCKRIAAAAATGWTHRRKKSGNR